MNKGCGKVLVSTKNVLKKSDVYIKFGQILGDGSGQDLFKTAYIFTVHE